MGACACTCMRAFFPLVDVHVYVCAFTVYIYIYIYKCVCVCVSENRCNPLI